MPGLTASLNDYRMIDRRAIHPDEYVARLTGAAGLPVATVRVMRNRLPDVRFATRSGSRHFLDWSYRLVDTKDATKAVCGALAALQAASVMTKYRGVVYRLADDPWPWDSGTVRAFPVGLYRQTARHLLQVHYRDQTPMIWQPDRQAFRLVRSAITPAKIVLPPPPVSDLPEQVANTQLDLFASVGPAVGALA